MGAAPLRVLCRPGVPGTARVFPDRVACVCAGGSSEAGCPPETVTQCSGNRHLVLGGDAHPSIFCCVVKVDS